MLCGNNAGQGKDAVPTTIPVPRPTKSKVWRLGVSLASLSEYTDGSCFQNSRCNNFFIQRPPILVRLDLVQASSLAT